MASGHSGAPRIGLIDRIQLDEVTGCWNWRGGRNAKGYPDGIRHWQTGRKIRAHRFSACLWLGLGPNDPRHVLHRCDNPSCFNPKHLFLGTNFDNQQDSVRKGRHWQIRKKFCSNGHVFDEKNTHLFSRARGGRVTTERICRACKRDATRLYLLKKKGG
jgi:hypothetical protein